MVHRPYLFEDLCIINKVLQSNFKSVCLEMELLENNKEQNQRLEELQTIENTSKSYFIRYNIYF